MNLGNRQARDKMWSTSAVSVSTLTSAERSDYFRRLAEADADGFQAILLQGDTANVVAGVDDAAIDSIIGSWARARH